jgi:hypothetical protein
MAAQHRRRTQEAAHKSNISTLSNPRIFYGWFLVAAAFAITFVGAALGWRNAYLVLGLLAAVVGAGMALMIENDPRERGLGPDGDPLRSGASSAQSAGASMGEAIRSQRFVGLYAACTCLRGQDPVARASQGYHGPARARGRPRQWLRHEGCFESLVRCIRRQATSRQKQERR